MAGIEIDLFGGFEARDAGGEPIALPLRARAILAFLALQQGWSARRSELAALIWSDRADAQARGSLRQELTALRRSLPEGVIEADRERVWLCSDRVRVLPSDDGRVLLEGLTLPSEAFHDWLRTEQMRAAEAAQRVLLDGAEAALAKGDAEQAQTLAGKLFDRDPCLPGAAALRMRAAAALARPAEALRTFERHRIALAEVLDTVPDPEILALAEEIRSGRAPEIAAPEGRVPVLAVLPFEEMGATDRDMFSDGVVEEITGALSRVHEFEVIARQSAFALRGQTLDAPTIAARLGADYLVEGSVRRSQDRVRISVQLVGASGRTLWAERYDDRLDDLFDLQDRIAAQVAARIAPNLRTAEIARASGRVLGDRSAYELTLTALPHFWAHRKEENRRAVALLEQATARDPDYVPAMAYRSWAVSQQPSYMWSDKPLEDHALAIRLADEAAARVTDHAPSLVAISATYSLSSKNVGVSRRFAERALAIDPNNAWGWMRLGWANIYGGNAEQALKEFTHADRLSPMDPFHFNMHLGKSAAYRSLGDFDAALKHLQIGMRDNPGMTWAYRMLVGTLLMAGREEEAIDAAREFRRHYPWVTLEYLYACWPKTVQEYMPDYATVFAEAFERAGIPKA